MYYQLNKYILHVTYIFTLKINLYIQLISFLEKIKQIIQNKNIN